MFLKEEMIEMVKIFHKRYRKWGDIPYNLQIAERKPGTRQKS